MEMMWAPNNKGQVAACNSQVVGDHNNHNDNETQEFWSWLKELGIPRGKIDEQPIKVFLNTCNQKGREEGRKQRREGRKREGKKERRKNKRRKNEKEND